MVDNRSSLISFMSSVVALVEMGQYAEFAVNVEPIYLILRATVSDFSNCLADAHRGCGGSRAKRENW